MAEFEQSTVKKGGGFKSQIANYAPQLNSPEPMGNVSYAKQQETRLWREVSKGIGAGAQLVKAYKEEKDSQVAYKMMKEMSSQHEKTMLTMHQNIQNTEIEDLDLQQTVNGFNERHNEDSPFMIGPRGQGNKPSVKIKDRSLEEYGEIPSSQRENVINHYNNLENSKKDWLLPELQKVLQEKGQLHLKEFATELYAESKTVFDDQESYSGGIGEHWYTEKSNDRIIEEGGGEVDPITKKSKYTLELMPSAVKKINGMIDQYDTKIIKMMKSGAIRADQAIVMQRTFVQGLLKQQMNTDIARNEDGVFNKIIHEEGYEWTKEMRYWGQRGKSGGEGTNRQKLLQTIRLPSSETSEFMNRMHERNKNDHKLKLENLKKDNVNNHVKDVELQIYNPDFMKNPANTVETVINKLSEAGENSTSKLRAKTVALNWSLKKNATIEGEEKEAYGQVIEKIGARILREPETMRKLLGKETKTGALDVLPDKTLKENLTKMFSEGATKEDIEIIQKGLKHLKPSDIQKYLNNVVASDIKFEKAAYQGEIQSYVETQAGRDTVVTQYLRFDEKKDLYVYDLEKLQKHKHRKHFGSDEELLTLLQPSIKLINEEHKNLKNQNAEFQLTDIQFRQAAGRYSNQQYQKIKAMSLNQTSSHGSEAQVVDDFIKEKLIKKKINPNKKDLQAYMTGHQIQRFKQYSQAFTRLGKYLAGAKDLSGKTSPVVLNKYYNNIMNNTNKGDYLNEYTGQAAELVAKQLYARMKSLNSTNFTDTIEKECFQDGAVNDACMAEKFKNFDVKPGQDVDMMGGKGKEELKDALYIESLESRSGNIGGSLGE